MRRKSSTNRLWAPWRIGYIAQAPMSDCFICDALRAHRDEENLILHRARAAVVIMNRFPYNNGHLMIAPRRHIGDYPRLTAAEQSSLWRLLPRLLKAIQAELRPEGFNIGMNLGKTAGAGLVGHLHIHIVPRWNGDTNFMPVLADTKVISEALTATYQKLLRRLRTQD